MESRSLFAHYIDLSSVFALGVWETKAKETTFEYSNPEYLPRTRKRCRGSGNFAKSYFLRKKREFLNPFRCAKKGNPTFASYGCWSCGILKLLYALLIQIPLRLPYMHVVVGRTRSQDEADPNPKQVDLINANLINRTGEMLMPSGGSGWGSGQEATNVFAEHSKKRCKTLKSLIARKMIRGKVLHRCICGPLPRLSWKIIRLLPSALYDNHYLFHTSRRPVCW